MNRVLLIVLAVVTLVPAPVFLILGYAGVRALEAEDARLRRAAAESAFLAALADAVRTARTPHPLPWSTPGQIAVLDEPSAAFLAHPALARARVLAAAGRTVDALEALDPLFLPGAPAPAQLAGRLLAADLLDGAGRGAAAAAVVAPLRAATGDDVTSGDPTVLRWAALRAKPRGAPAAVRSLTAWIDEVAKRPTDLQELVLLRELVARHAVGGASARVVESRHRWPEEARALADRRRSLDAAGPALFWIPHGWFGSGGDLAWPIKDLAERVASLQGEEFAGARLAPPGAGGNHALRGVLRGDGFVVDLGGHSVALVVAPSRLFGGTDPRAWLLLGVALYAVLAVVLVGAVRRQQRRASQLVQAQGDLVARVTHELRTPLTVLRMYGESLARRRVPPEKEGQYLATMAAEAARLGLLVDKVAEAAREDEAGPPAAGTCDVVAVTGRAVRGFDAVAASDGGRVTLAAPPEPLPATIDADELRLVLDVLIENALGHGGPLAEVAVTLEAGAREVIVTVADRGPGIDPADAARLFERFRRGRTARGRGAGMGLHLARRAARAAGGEVMLAARAGGGAIATVTLPRSTEGTWPPS